ncbi:MAG TPA: oligosaccharide flippase family protein [Candidatus Cloacimonadota bacterium]|nr:oligosaccharide flippase family protein [Candidatus Cloacimonadota bacterium]HOR58161.1 oligosaccharide flippase family protein [Candidatus Cloacimonadota bacterium]HPL22780.1 oligosaccharide flippase family protein [Candidatus Cloacimonadota bacterium]
MKKLLSRLTGFLALNTTNIKQRILNASMYFSASLVQVVVGLILSPILSMHLGHRDFAIVGYFNSFNALFGPLTSMALSSYYGKHYFVVDAQQRERLRKTIVSTLLVLGLGATLFILGSFYIYTISYDTGFDFFPYAVLCYSNLVFSNIYAFYLLNLRLAKKASGFLWVNIAHHGAYLLAMILLCAVLKFGAAGSLAATLVVSVLFGTYFFFKMTDRIFIDKALLISALRFCWPLIVAGCIDYFTNGIDRAMLAGLKDDVNLGLYSIALRFSGYIYMFYYVISITLEPDFFQALSTKRHSRLIKITLGLIISNVLIVLAFIVATPLILKILTVGRYTAAAGLTRIMALKSITAAFYFIISTIIIIKGYTKITLLNKAIAALVITSVFRYLISNYQFVGAAWGQVLSYVVFTAVSAAFLLYKYLTRSKIRL